MPDARQRRSRGDCNFNKGLLTRCLRASLCSNSTKPVRSKIPSEMCVIVPARERPACRGALRSDKDTTVTWTLSYTQGKQVKNDPSTFQSSSETILLFYTQGKQVKNDPSTFESSSGTIPLTKTLTFTSP
jgi:hypothetical protein